MLEAHLKPNTPRLCAIVAYYPTAIPSPNTHFPPSVQVLVHLAGAEVGVRRTTEVLGIQGKRKTVRKRVDPGAGYGQSLKLGYKAYTYSGCEPGFAEHDLDEYDAVAEGVAFTRSLTTVRRGFRLEPDIEGVHDPLTDATKAGQTEKAMKQTGEYAHVIHGPTLTGGVGTKDLSRFYQEFFQPLPPSFHARLLSRTVGTDRVVDELFVTFMHSQEIAWILPDIPATGKKVEIIIVSIVCVRGGKLESEHVYWDQASVLVQVSLLSPKAVPEAMKKQGVEELPVTGAEAARAVKRGSSKHLNELMLDW